MFSRLSPRRGGAPKDEDVAAATTARSWTNQLCVSPFRSTSIARPVEAFARSSASTARSGEGIRLFNPLTAGSKTLLPSLPSPREFFRRYVFDWPRPKNFSGRRVGAKFDLEVPDV